MGTCFLRRKRRENIYIRTHKRRWVTPSRPYLAEDAHRVPEEVETADDLVQLPKKGADVVALERVRQLESGRKRGEKTVAPSRSGKES